METKKKTKTKPAQKPVHTVRRAGIAASIWSRVTQTGLEYHDFTLSRSWMSPTSGKKGYSSSFFARNAHEIAEVVAEASQWILENTPGSEAQHSDSDEPQSVPLAKITPVQVPASEARH